MSERAPRRLSGLPKSAISLDARLLAEQSAEKCALLVMLAPPELRKVVLTDLLKAFRRVCAQHGVTAEPAVVRYYAALIKDSLRQAAPFDPAPTRH